MLQQKLRGGQTNFCKNHLFSKNLCVLLAVVAYFNIKRKIFIGKFKKKKTDSKLEFYGNKFNSVKKKGHINDDDWTLHTGSQIISCRYIYFWVNFLLTSLSVFTCVVMLCIFITKMLLMLFYFESHTLIIKLLLLQFTTEEKHQINWRM